MRSQRSLGHEEAAASKPAAASDTPDQLRFISSARPFWYEASRDASSAVS